ncbi:unnamed protein product [Enterobius vermicularis]|uniref:Farnesyl pyrophosphate synthase n=1 Tax=Enterobius vermicularis TaxID=51028 RepID=A0A0N4V402_ENTVE|nr:unnamed protein product [Enterobius vermicularis]
MDSNMLDILSTVANERSAVANNLDVNVVMKYVYIYVQMSERIIRESLNTVKKIMLNDISGILTGTDVLSCQKQFTKFFDYVVYGGKYLRSTLLTSIFRHLEPSANSAENKRTAEVAACLEVLQAFYLTLDDIVDGGIQRRGKPCWHTLTGVGVNAINDSLLLESSIHKALFTILRGHPLASSVCDYFCEIKRVTTIGQILDGATSGIKDCTWERYRNIVYCKTSFYTTCAPVYLALLLADQRKYWTELEPLCVNLGYLFQAQDDFLDCYGHVEDTGKTGTDLKEGKCTWITCKAVEKLESPEFSSYSTVFEVNFLFTF